MKINKFKDISVAICCLLTALWAEINGAEEQRDEPAGIINSFAGEMAPDGWLLCNGQEYNSREYPRLYEVVKTRYVLANEELRVLRHNAENNFKLFCVPDLRGRVIVGVDGGAGRVTFNNTLGAIGGEEMHKLTIAELASHPHKMFDAITGSRSLPATAVLSGTNPNLLCSAYTEEAGGDQPHNNMQPYQILNYIISTGKMDGRRETALINAGIVEQFQQKILELNLTLANLSARIPEGLNLLGSAKAWFVFNGITGSVLSSFGIQSVIRNSTGSCTVTFSTPFLDINYCPVGTAGWSAATFPCYVGLRNFLDRTTLKFIFETRDRNNLADSDRVQMVIYGNQ